MFGRFSMPGDRRNSCAIRAYGLNSHASEQGMIFLKQRNSKWRTVKYPTKHAR
jgi:hypothetical protein